MTRLSDMSDDTERDPHDYTGERDYGEYGQCTATSKQTNERCKAPATGEHGKCYSHGGSGDSGPPKGSTNAMKHGLHADGDALFRHFSSERKQRVINLEHALIDRYKEYHNREPDAADIQDLYEVALSYVHREFAREYMVEQAEESGNPLLEHVEMEKDGEEIEFDKPNAILDVVHEMRREDRMLRKDKGLEKDPESEKADSMDSFASAFRDGLRDGPQDTES